MWHKLEIGVMVKMILDARIDPRGTVHAANTTRHVQVALGSNVNIIE
jgi:hypothetical protein